jgi:NADH-quinone oxidoreductase subunit J
MVTDYILFFSLAAVAIASALGMLLSKHAVYSALNLIINFLAVAIFYLLLDAPFIALTQITVYAGAIMVLFLFVIMLLGAEQLKTSNTLRWQRPAAAALGVILFIEAMYILFFYPQTRVIPAVETANFGSPAAVGDVLFNVYLLPFEIISILLLVAMVGAIVLSKRQRRGG